MFNQLIFRQLVHIKNTDIIAGVESGIETVLVLSGVTNFHIMRKFPYRPSYIYIGVGDIIKGIPAEYDK